MILSGCSSAAAESQNTEEITLSDNTVNLNFKASDYYQLGTYKGITVDLSEQTISDDDVEEEVQKYLNEYASSEEITDRAAADGDTVNLNIAGTADGKKVDALTAYSFTETIGDNDLGEEFEKQLIGIKTGETKTFSVSYADDYADTDIAGKTVTYTVTVNQIVHYTPVEESDDGMGVRTKSWT